ncbi:low choriolytic enzyme-like isoform X2 [Zootermopsis nevadensis]|uniref:low choriolytic enzyme-like isoform X2 n=1 Tax=Zootermopsis nevadensis TaxID=136037 RepID=UPI000B8EA4C4|nr:low choriolytic enzyme-like isoform X2 [Zootermopsis nevadensis]
MMLKISNALSTARKTMFGHYCLVFVAIGHLYSVEASVIRHLSHLITHNRSVATEELDLPQRRERSPSQGSFLTSLRPSQNYVVNKAPAPAPLIDTEEGNYFEGDIILRPEQQLSSKKLMEGKGARMLWPGRTLYYDYSHEFSAQHVAIIESAISDLQRETCVRFVRRTTEPTYILLRNTNRGCASQVGYHPIGSGIDLYLSSPGCLKTGTIQHELLHALGFWHEHTRPDRDRFISIFWDNIISGRELNFRARSHYEPHEWLPYDYHSVMHYRAVAFSKDSISATIVPRDHKAFFTIGQRVRFSPMDLAKLNVLYKCGSNYYKGNDMLVESPLPESENVVSSNEKPFSGTEKETSSSKSKEDISSEEDLFSKSGTERDLSNSKPSEE